MHSKIPAAIANIAALTICMLGFGSACTPKLAGIIRLAARLAVPRRPKRLLKNTASQHPINLHANHANLRIQNDEIGTTYIRRGTLTLALNFFLRGK